MQCGTLLCTYKLPFPCLTCPPQVSTLLFQPHRRLFMLSSTCSVYLDPFNAEEAPLWRCFLSTVGIPLSYYRLRLFPFLRCLAQITPRPPRYPKCRNSFSDLESVKLLVDFDILSASAATQLQDRVNQVNANGAAEAITTRLIKDCRDFFRTVEKQMARQLLSSTR